MTVDRSHGFSRDTGWEKSHLDIEKTIRMSYVEVVPDEKQETKSDILLLVAVCIDC